MASRDESVSSVWEDELSKTLNMESLGGEESIEPPHLGGGVIKMLPSHQLDPGAHGDLGYLLGELL